MRINYFKTSMFIIVVLVVLTGLQGSAICAPKNSSSAGYREYDIKAAFLYNFIKFTDWPQDKVTEPNTITIGLLGEHDFKDAFEAVKNQPISGNRLIIKSLGKFVNYTKIDDSGKLKLTDEIEKLRKCHILFVCDSEKKYYKEIIGAIKDWHVLTVGETEDFLDAGGIITFIPGTGKPVFEISNAVAKDEKIRISSRVLRLARKVRDE